MTNVVTLDENNLILIFHSIYDREIFILTKFYFVPGGIKLIGDENFDISNVV
jgi:hypothetical protein